MSYYQVGINVGEKLRSYFAFAKAESQQCKLIINHFNFTA